MIGDRHMIWRSTTTKRLDSPCERRCSVTFANRRCEVELPMSMPTVRELDVLLAPDEVRQFGALLLRQFDVLVDDICIVHRGEFYLTSTSTICSRLGPSIMTARVSPYL